MIIVKIGTNKFQDTDMTRMHLDSIARYDRTIHIAGWCELNAHPEFSLSMRGVRAKIYSIPRPDVMNMYGETSEKWGFEAVFLFDTAEEARESLLGNLVFEVSGRECVCLNKPSEIYGAQNNEQLISVESIFFNSLSKCVSPSILEIGSRARSGITRRELFPGAKYLGVDVMDGANVDMVVDVHELSKKIHAQFDYVYSVSVFEHILMPWKAAVEIAKCMSIGAMIFVQSHQAWPVHDAPCDYWRFTQDAWVAIFNRYTGFEILATGCGQPCHYASAFDNGSPIVDFRRQYGYYASSVVAKKICDPTLDWSITPTDLITEKYPM